MRRILIVDDMPDNLFLLEELLKASGFKVCSAHNGEEALDVARNTPPDLVVSDILMPVMDGYTLCREWRADERLRRIPFMFYTATFTEKEDEELALSLGADCFLIKPQDAEVLIDAINRVISSPPGETPSQTPAPRPDEEEVLKHYSEALFSKLEKKMEDLERVNRDLAESERQFRLFIMECPVPIAVSDLQGNVELLNNRFVASFGYTLDDIPTIDAWWHKAYPEQGYWEHIQALWQATMENMLNSGGTAHTAEEYRITCETGMTRFVKISAARITTKTILVFNDTTESKLAEQEVKEGREMLRLIFDSTAEAIFGIDLNGCCTFCNRACLDILGYDSQEELLGVNMHDRIHYGLADGTHKPARECRICNAFRLGKGTHADDELIWRKDGASFPAEYWSHPQWKDGKIVGAVVTFLDITDRKRNENLLQHMQGQVVHQEKMASVGLLAAGVAHEINNPMGFITSNLTSLGKYAGRLDEYITAQQASLQECEGHQGLEELDRLRQRLKVDYIISDIRELINESLDGANRVRRIVQDLKSFSRLDQVECCHTNLNDALNTTINIAWNELKYIATLERDFGDIPSIVCYPQQLNQVFLNLLLNAAQAMEKQGVITVRTWNDNDNVFVSVADTGKGMSDDVRRRVFEPFFTTKEPGKGTGLGLSISADIVRKHGGEISVQSKTGKGTTFTVRLPISNPLRPLAS